jgi:hypothetical protein
MDIFDEILTTKELLEHPPILLDIGASGKIDQKWRQIAKHSICIAFDADEREMGYIEQESKGYKKLYVYNCIASDDQSAELDFYLTKSPYCSSLLHPDNKAIEDYAFAPLFEVEQTVKMKAIELKSVFQQLNLDYLDWFKTDSQGTDLRLFLNLGDDLINRILVAEFEPGIMDAYQGEDKLYTVMSCLEKKNFWMSAMNVQGTQRIQPKSIDLYFNKLEKKYLQDLHRVSPGWGEITYFKKLGTNLTKRDLLLFWIFAIIDEQYGFSLEIAQQGQKKYFDPIFDELIKQSLKKFKESYYPQLAGLFLKKAKLKLSRIFRI